MPPGWTRPAAVCTAALRLTCTEKGTRTFPPPWCRRLEHRRRLLVCADAAAGALMEPGWKPCPGRKGVRLWHPELCRPQGGGTDRPPGCPQAGRCRRIGPGTGGTAPCGGRAVRWVLGAGREISAAAGHPQGCWLRTVYREDGPGLWLLDMIRRQPAGLPQVPGTSWQHYRDPVPEAVPARLQRRRRPARLRPKRSAAGCAGCCCCWWRWPWPRWRRVGGSPAVT